MYLMVCTRPDISFARRSSSVNSWQAQNKVHWEAVQKILRYVKGTADLELVLGAGDSGLQLRGYTDADWGANDINRRSISGYIFKYGAGAISWSSKKQTSVALSSTEAEYMALTQAAKEAIWLKRLLKELGQDVDGGVLLNVDNQSCIALARNPEFHARTKHIDIQHHFIREKVEDKAIQLIFCPTKQNGGGRSHQAGQS